MFNRLSAALTLLPRRLLLVSSPRTLTGACRFLGRMNPAVVRCLPGEPKLTISFSLDGGHRNMMRDQDEPLGKTLSRISHNKVKKSKKKKGETQGEAPVVTVKLYYNGEEVSDMSLNSEAWRDGAVLQVGDVEYSVRRNTPSFTNAELPASLLAEFPVCPNLEIEFGNLEDCEFTWYRENAPNTR